MTFFKHILLMVALLAATMPCCHAVGHGEAAHDNDTADASIDALHACACHSCDETICREKIEMPQEIRLSSDVIELPVVALPFFVFPGTRSLKRPAPPAVVGILASIQTVQLLI